MNAKVFPDLFGDTAAELIGRLLVMALILALTSVIRRLVWRQVPRLVQFLTTRTRTTVDEQLLMVLKGPAHFLFGLLGIGLALEVLEAPGILGTLLTRLLASLVAITILAGLYRTVDMATHILRGMFRHSTHREITALEEKLFQFVQKVAKGLVIVMIVVVVLDRWSFNVGSLLAGLGLGGLAVALAAQDALANLIGYFLIVADEPFLIGEYIALSGDTAGTVESLGFRSTRIRQPDQSLVIVPNKTIVSTNIVNWSRLTKRRLDMTLGLTGKSSVEQVLSVVQAVREMMQNHPQVQSDSVIVQFSEFGDHALNVRIVCFMKTPAWNDFQAARQDINLKIMQIMEERGVEFGVPTFEIMLGKAAVPSPQAARLAPQPEPAISTIADSPVPDDAAN